MPLYSMACDTMPWHANRIILDSVIYALWHTDTHTHTCTYHRTHVLRTKISICIWRPIESNEFNVYRCQWIDGKLMANQLSPDTHSDEVTQSKWFLLSPNTREHQPFAISRGINCFNAFYGSPSFFLFLSQISLAFFLLIQSLFILEIFRCYHLLNIVKSPSQFQPIEFGANLKKWIWNLSIAWIIAEHTFTDLWCAFLVVFFFKPETHFSFHDFFLCGSNWGNTASNNNAIQFFSARFVCQMVYGVVELSDLAKWFFFFHRTQQKCL